MKNAKTIETALESVFKSLWIDKVLLCILYFTKILGKYNLR